MERKIVGMFVCVLMLTMIFPVSGTTNGIKTDIDMAFKTFGRNNSPPYAPSNPDPSGEFPVCIDVNLSWDGGDPDSEGTVTYYVYLGIDGSPPLNGSVGPYPANQTRIQYDPQGVLKFNTKYYWCIVACDNYGALATGPIWSFTTEENLPPNEPGDPFPEDGATKVPVNVTLYWEAGDPNSGDSVTYDVYFGTTIPPPQRTSNQTYTFYKPPDNLTLFQTYYWLIVAWDSQELSTSGLCWTFTAGSRSPDAPIIDGPTSGKVGVEYAYNFSLSDPDDDSMYLRVDWGNGTPGPWQGLYDSDTTVKLNHIWHQKGTYIIRAQAKDIFDAESKWGYLEVSVPKNKQATHKTMFFQLFERFAGDNFHSIFFPLHR